MSGSAAALCERCWRLVAGEREPVRVKSEFARTEVCAICGQHTRSGIYRRIAPEDQPHYTPDDEEIEMKVQTGRYS